MESSRANGETGSRARKTKPYPTTAPPSKAKDKKDGLFGTLSKLRKASRRPLPTNYGDGTYPVVQVRPKLRSDIRALLDWKDLKTLLTVVKAKIKGETTTDDKTMIMERLIALVAGLEHNSKTREKLTNTLIAGLWNSLEHPPMLFMGDKFKYRSADGSYNNPYFPRLGAAGETYARTCKPRIASLGALPDPNLIFEAVMMRGQFKKHPNNVSSILWYWATIIIHDLFWSDSRDMEKNKQSSYLDLSPLYGCSQQMQDSVRTFRDGKLKADSFADKRLLGVPPGVCVLLIMFNRFHNHVAENLAAINERGRFSRPSGARPEDNDKNDKNDNDNDNDNDDSLAAAWKKYDEDLFQTARLVTCGLYINITLVDYVRNIVNLNRCDTTWTLDPRQEAGIDVGTREGAEAGVGNVVSAEFNLCYRWHSCISEKDDKWAQQLYGKILGSGAPGASGAPGVRPSMEDMMGKFAAFERSIPDDPLQRVFGGLERQPDGRFDDGALVDIISSAIEDCAGAFGARNVPQVMRHVEIMGIIRGRRWNLAGLNEFRQHFGLQPYATFEAINSDPAVAEQLRRLYEHPDNVELYPGIVAEEAKTPMVPGVGIAPTYTISRVVLSDAVALVRGDRYYTIDYHPRNLTAWGHNEASYDLGLNHGCVFYKLFIRAFPHHFAPDSVYAHYPMVIPAENRKILTALRRADLFDFGRPAFRAPRIDIGSYGAAKYVLENPDRYRVTWHEGLSFLMADGGRRFMLAGDSPAHARQRQCMAAQLYRPGWLDAVRRFYAAKTEQLLRDKSHRVAGRVQADLVRDVGNLVHTHFAARVFNLPLKTADRNPGGIYTEQELYGILSAIFVTIFFDIDPAKSFPLRQATKAVTTPLGKLIELNTRISRLFGLRGLYTGRAVKGDDDPLAGYGVNMVRGLARSGLSNYDIAWSHVLPTAGAMVPNQAQVFAQAADFYLDTDKAALRTDISRIARQPASADSDALLLGYAMEGVRLAGTFGSYRQAASDDTIREDDGRVVPVASGARVFVSFVSAARDPERFPDPDAVNPRRPLDSYIHYGFGPHACLGRDVSQVALTEIFRAVFRKRNLRRSPGPQGELKKVPRPGGFFVYMKEDWSSLWPFPTSMKVMWDDEEDAD